MNSNALRWMTLLFLLSAGAALSLTPAAVPARAEDEAETTPMLEVALDGLAPGADGERLAKLVRAVDENLRKLPGFVRSDVASVTAPSKRLLRATVWRSIESLEAASLARDGDKGEAALRSSLDPAVRSTRYFRQLRSKRYTDSPTGHLEVTFYRTRVGTTRAQNLARFDKAEADFARGEGVLAHSMWIAPDGLWAHVVHWRDEAAFSKTGRTLMQTKGVGEWIRSLDFKRFKIWKGNRIKTH